MFRTSIITLFLVITVSLMAQYEQTAPKALDKLAENIAQTQGINIDFNIKIQELGKDDILDSDKGSLLLKNETYVLSFNGTSTYFDGKNQWIYLEEEQEVSVQPQDEEEITAASIFKQYDEGFRFRTLKEDNLSTIIELSPIDKSSPYLRITMHIDIVNNRLKALVIQSRNAMLTEINVTSWQEESLDEDDFIFNTEQHPNVEVIDLR